VRAVSLVRVIVAGKLFDASSLLVALQDFLKGAFADHPAAPAIAQELLHTFLRAVDMAAKSGHVTDPAMWARAFTAAASELASEELATRWMALTGKAE
jgi:hypothetical protein